MMYVALLRGINVGSKARILMADLRASFEAHGFTDVSTLLASGNVLFNSSERNQEKLEERIEAFLSKDFKYDSTVLVRSSTQIKKTIQKIPTDWKKRKDIRCYIAFVKKPLTVSKGMKEISVREGIDTLDAGPGVLYMTTKKDGLAKSSFNKLAKDKTIYSHVTIRNFNTLQKIATKLDSFR